MGQTLQVIADRRGRGLVAKLPSLVWCLACFVVLIYETAPSEYPDIYIWSKLRFSALVVLLAACGYFLYSVFHPRLTELNNYLSYLVIVVGCAMEILLRLVPSVIPDGLILYAPKNVRKEYAIRHGFIIEELLSTGKNRLLYHFNPGQKLEAYPYVRVDRLGYRNAVDETGMVDVVILGDSLTLALESREDIADLLRHHGYSALNLGMFGYAPQHYRDAYKDLVIERGISHRYVFLFMFVGNDFQDAAHYEQMSLARADYRAYLPQFSELDAAYENLPLVVNISRGLPRYAKSRLFTNRPRTISLPYKSITTGELLPPPQISANSPDWRYVLDAIDEIIVLARRHQAVPAVFLLPSPATLYSKYDTSLAQFDEAYLSIAGTLRSHFEQKRVVFGDLNQPLKLELDQNFIYASDSDCHLNSLGVRKVFDNVSRYLEPPQILDGNINLSRSSVQRNVDR